MHVATTESLPRCEMQTGISLVPIITSPRLYTSGVKNSYPGSGLPVLPAFMDDNSSMGLHWGACESTQELLVDSTGSRTSTLGRHFLTSAYLMVDHDSESCTLWQANPSSKSKPVPVGSNNSSRKKTSSAEDAALGQRPSSESESGLYKGATASIVVGVLTGLGLLGVAVFFFLPAKNSKGSSSLR
ncbi:hypothetical protein ACJZ2D_001323 [Fusarium nematophilum]